MKSSYFRLGQIEDAANTFTVEFWVKPVTEHEIDVETNTGYGGTENQKFVIFPAHGGDNTGKAGMGVSVGTNGVSVYEHAGGYMPAILVWQSPTPLTAWTHVAVVYNNKLPSLYINGQLVHTAGAASTKDYVYPCYQFPGGYYGTQTGGQMDEVRIWGVARTQQQIAANMNTEVAANSANLLGYWPMNEGTGTMLTDVTGNGRNIDLIAFGAGYSGNGSWTSTGTAAIAAKAAYRYAFNGKEKDSDIGEDEYDYGMRIYDARLGRFLSVDPITKNYPELTPYQFGSNRPIDGIDQDGLEWKKTETYNPKTGVTNVHFQVQLKVANKSAIFSKMTELKAEITSRFSEAFKNIQKGNIHYSSEIKIIESPEVSFDKGDFGVDIYDPLPPTPGKIPLNGMSGNGNSQVATFGVTSMDYDIKTKTQVNKDVKSIAHDIVHEIIHKGGVVEHPQDDGNKAKDVDLTPIFNPFNGKFITNLPSPGADKKLIFSNILLYGLVSIDGKKVNETQPDRTVRKKVSPDQATIIRSTVEKETSKK